MNQNQENNNFTSDKKAFINFENKYLGFKTFNSWLNSLTDPKKKFYIPNTEQKKEILVQYISQKMTFILIYAFMKIL